MMNTSRRHRSREEGFSLVEVMVSATIIVVGLLAVASASTTSALLRKRGAQEDLVFNGMTARLEWVRGELFTASAFHQNAFESLDAGLNYMVSFPLDNDGDGAQDLSFAPGDAVTPIIQVTVAAPGAPASADDIVQVVVRASWYGVGGNRTANLTSFVANRGGFGG